MNLAGLDMGSHKHRDVAGSHRTVIIESRRACQQRDDVRRHITGHGGTGGADAGRLLRMDHPHPRPRLIRQAHQSRSLVLRADRMHGDPRIAELKPTHDGLHPTDHSGIAAVVGRQRGVRARLLGGIQVTEHIGTAEGVDGLLRVADQDQRAPSMEDGAQNVPLRWIGVLELINQDHLVCLPQPVAGQFCTLRIGDGLLKSQHEVVEGHQPSVAASAQDLGAYRLRERDPSGLQRTLLDRPGVKGCLWIIDRGPGDRLRLRVGDTRLTRIGVGVLAYVEVVHHLIDQVGDVLHERLAGVGVGVHANRLESLFAEAVSGGDRAGVEVGNCLGESA